MSTLADKVEGYIVIQIEVPGIEKQTIRIQTYNDGIQYGSDGPYRVRSAGMISRKTIVQRLITCFDMILKEAGYE